MTVQAGLCRTWSKTKIWFSHATAHFILSYRRTNVALTRARHHLLIVGHYGNLSRNSLWQKILEHCRGKDSLMKQTNIELMTPHRAASVAEWIRAINHLTISRLCLVWVLAPHGAHVRQAKLCLRVVPCGFSRGGSPIFAPPTDWPVSYELK